jgi:protein-S-isoprenylcysteine O-methyltransferase Ste14
MNATLHRCLILVVGYAERYLLSLIFFGLACREFTHTYFALHGHSLAETAVFLDASHHMVTLLLDLITGLVLLIGFRASVPSTTFKSIFIPLIVTFYPAVYNFIQLFPPLWQIDLCPVGWQKAFIIAGFICIILIGPLIALWGLLYLGRSFGIFVTLRKVVLTGPYRWVRHPMYLGWVVIYLGVALSNFSPIYLALVAIQLSLLLYRAHLEETHLARHSPEYREYMTRTGFIVPRLLHIRPDHFKNRAG